MTLAVTGGGTGGHIFPAIAVAEALRSARSDVEVIYIGGAAGREATIVPQHGLRFIGVPARKIRRTASPDTLITLVVLFRGYLQARSALRRLGASAVLGTGGYVAAAAVLAASRLNIPVVIHEQNAVAGRTNRWLARKAERVCITFAASAGEFPAGKVIETGLPIRHGLVSPLTRAAARAQLGIPEASFTVVVVGGSQGAAAINRVVWESLDSLNRDISIIHQTGDTEGGPGEHVRDAGVGSVYRSRPFLDTENLAAAYRAADVAVCRCGASTLAEVAAAGLPSLLIPYPLAYADHQTANARAVAEAGGGVLIPQADLTSARLAEELHALKADQTRRQRMADATRAMARPDAAQAVAEVVLRCVRDANGGRT